MDKNGKVWCPSCQGTKPKEVVYVPGSHKVVRCQECGEIIRATTPTLEPDKLYYQIFAVRGCGYFPIDMLRYDRCYPITEAGAYTIAQSILGILGIDTEWEVILGRHTAHRSQPPTIKRWQSFGCEVVKAPPDPQQPKQRS